MGGCGASNRYSWLAAAGCFAGTAEGLSYNQVLVRSKRAPDAIASREANFGTAIQVLAASVNYLSRAAMAAITRVANQGLAISVVEPTPLKISRVARRSHAAPRHFSQEAMWARSAEDKASLKASTLVAAGRTAAACSIESINFLHSSPLFFSRFHIPASLPLYRSCLRHQSPRFFAWLTTRRRARKSLTFTVFPFRLRTSAISSMENPSTSFSISISRSRSSNPSSRRSTRSRASILWLASGPGFSFSPDAMTCLACSSLRSDSYTRGRTFFFLSKSQHSFTVILYSQVLNAAR